MITAIATLAIASAVLSAPPGMGGDFNIQVEPHGVKTAGEDGGPTHKEAFNIQGGPGNDGVGHEAFGRHGPPPPPYLGNVSDEARQEYFAIVSNTNITVAQQKQNVLAWAQKNGVEAQVQEFNTNMTNLMTQMKQNVTLLINSLPSALQQLLSVAGNETLSREQQKNAMRTLVSQNPQVYHIIKLATAHSHPRELGLPHGNQNFATAVMDAPEEENEFGAAVMPHEDPSEEHN